jgi:hypothetical protein
MIQPTGNVPFDLAALAAERTRQAAEAAATTQAQATLACKNYLVAIIAAGAANGVSVVNEQTALNAINSSGAP